MLKVGEDVTPRDPKGEGGYEDVKISKYLGGTTAYMRRLAMATKGCCQLTSNNNYFADSCFIGPVGSNHGSLARARAVARGPHGPPNHCY